MCIATSAPAACVRTAVQMSLRTMATILRQEYWASTNSSMRNAKMADGSVTRAIITNVVWMPGAILATVSAASISARIDQNLYPNGHFGCIIPLLKAR